MRKQEQQEINAIIDKALDEFLQEGRAFYDSYEELDVKRLRSCSAHVIDFKHYYVLVSYSTVIAFIDKDTNTLYDFLRKVYGYTSTSAQHIAKFRHDYYCTSEYRYYPLY